VFASHHRHLRVGALFVAAQLAEKRGATPERRDGD
jgi:hypothetical protein